MIFVVGSTGLVGGEICRLLAEEGKPVRAMVRKTWDPGKVGKLKEMDLELVYGGLKGLESLKYACRGCQTVISTAARILSRQEGDSIQTADWEGQLSLVDGAKRKSLLFKFHSHPRIFP